jgi:hypothetical protein
MLQKLALNIFFPLEIFLAGTSVDDLKLLSDAAFYGDILLLRRRHCRRSRCYQPPLLDHQHSYLKNLKKLNLFFKLFVRFQ